MKSVIFLRSEEGLTSSDKDNSANFPGLKCSRMKPKKLQVKSRIYGRSGPRI